MMNGQSVAYLTYLQALDMDGFCLSSRNKKAKLTYGVYMQFLNPAAEYVLQDVPDPCPLFQSVNIS